MSGWPLAAMTQILLPMSSLGEPHWLLEYKTGEYSMIPRENAISLHYQTPSYYTFQLSLPFYKFVSISVMC